MVTIHGDGKAGQYAKSQATRVLQRYFASGAIAFLVTGVVFGSFFTLFGISWLARHLGPHVVAIMGWAAVVLLGAALALVRLWRDWFTSAENDFVRERLKWLRGGHAEALVAWRLRDGLDGKWHLFNNLELPGRGDIDHILIGPRGVFCISTKAHRGMYSLAPNGTHLLNMRPTDHLTQAQQLAMELRRRLSTFCRDVPWVQPVLAAPFAYVDFGLKQNNVWVLHEDALCENLAKGDRSIGASEVEQIVRGLKSLAGHNAVPDAP